MSKFVREYHLYHVYQRRDDDKVIELARSINTIRARFGQSPLVLGGGVVEAWDKVGVGLVARGGTSVGHVV